MKKYYISNGYATGKVFESTYEEAILKCLKSVNAMCTCWLYELGGGEIGRTYKVDYYNGYMFASNVDGKKYGLINKGLICG